MTKLSVIKFLGFLLIIIGLIVAISCVANQLDFRGGFYDLITEGLIPALIVILLTLPIGRIYIRLRTESLSHFIKIALWLHYISIFIFLVALIPLISNLLGRMDGESAPLMSLFLGIIASVPYIIGILFLIINKFKVKS